MMSRCGRRRPAISTCGVQLVQPWYVAVRRQVDSWYSGSPSSDSAACVPSSTTRRRGCDIEHTSGSSVRRCRTAVLSPSSVAAAGRADGLPSTRGRRRRWCGPSDPWADRENGTPRHWRSSTQRDWLTARTRTTCSVVHITLPDPLVQTKITRVLSSRDSRDYHH